MSEKSMFLKITRRWPNKTMEPDSFTNKSNNWK